VESTQVGRTGRLSGPSLHGPTALRRRRRRRSSWSVEDVEGGRRSTLGDAVRARAGLVVRRARAGGRLSRQEQAECVAARQDVASCPPRRRRRRRAAAARQRPARSDNSADIYRPDIHSASEMGAKYCDEHVCLSARISETTRPNLPKFECLLTTEEAISHSLAALRYTAYFQVYG